MTAIDFAAFVDELATAVRRGDPAVLPHLARRRGQGFGPGLRSGDGGRPRRRKRHALADQAELPRARHRRRGVRQRARATPNMSGCSTRSTAPSPSSAGMPAWGTLIALTRNGEPVFGMMHQPFIGERFTGDGGAAHYRGPAGERALHVRPCASARRRDAVHHQPAADERGRPRRLRPRRGRGAALALRRRLLRLLHAGRRPCRSGDRDRAQAARHRGADPDHRGRRRRSSPPGKAQARRKAVASSRPATSACMPRRWRCCE